MALSDTSSRLPTPRRDVALEKSIRASMPQGTEVSAQAFDRVIAASDASHYLLTPRAVVAPRSTDEVAALFAFATSRGEPLTFRSGGTSLSGQASASNILVDTRKHFRSITVLEEGCAVKVDPGATVRQVNSRLLRFGRKLGPDPASEIACTIGGVVANNSSGMACGVDHNTYRTLRSAVIVLASGTVVDSADGDADEKLRRQEPQLARALEDLRTEVLASPTLRAEIDRQFRIKNTMGYGLNSLVDHSSPVQILTHLMIGSEGTLGFVAEATFNTVPLHKHAATTLLVFDTLRMATDALVAIVGTDPATVELMDASSLRAARLDPESRASLPEFDLAGHCALLIEYQCATSEELDDRCAQAEELFAQLVLTVEPQVTQDPATRASLWHIRKGLYATIAGARPSGTTALLEDVAVPVNRLSETCAGLTSLFERYGYGEAVIFGHAKDGNVHFMISEDFTNTSSVARYRAFTEEMVELILGMGGTLKAEHGTGRIMAPFVARQYGPELYRMMLDIKRSFDPRGILNPDTILTEDSDLHLRNLKSTPTVEEEVDRCVECGYCEPVCPSKDLTTTPRQRIVLRRAMAEAEMRGDARLLRELTRKQRYEVIETCAVDGMCQTACPVRINTGDLVRRLRAEDSGGATRAAWRIAGRAWGAFTGVSSRVMSVAAAVPASVVTIPNVLARGLLGADRVPLWSQDLPRGGAARQAVDDKRYPAEAVFFQSCVGVMFGPAEGGIGGAAAFQSLARKAGIQIVRPREISGLCCGTPWKSKGMLTSYQEVVERTVESLWETSEEGAIPVVCDNSSCSEGLVAALKSVIETHPKYRSLTIVDAVDFASEFLLPNLTIEGRLDSIVVHPTCSSTRAGSNGNLVKLASAVASDVTVPADWGCCAFAGDRGLLHPELTASATMLEAAEVGRGTHQAFVSCNRTCEIGMSRATGENYQHVLEVLDQLSVSGAGQMARPIIKEDIHE